MQIRVAQMRASRMLILLTALFSAQITPVAVAQDFLNKPAEGSLNKSAKGSLNKQAKGSSLGRYVLGGVNRCAKIPIFFDTLQMSEQTVVDTTITRLPGVVLRELDGQGRLYQKPSWRKAGNVGAVVRDSIGNIYVIPVPSVSLEGNPLERRNIVYKVNSRTGLMVEYVRLPLPEASSQENPFGTVALDLDCETNSLYVSSVAGSTVSSVNGVIYRIDLNTGKIADQYSGFDAIGLGVFNMPNEKRLYLGDARSSSLYSIVLGKDGRFIKGQAPKYETSLLSIKNGDSTQIKKIRFTRGPRNTHIMTLSDTEFVYRMQAQSSRRFRHYEFVLDFKEKYWVFNKITY